MNYFYYITATRPNYFVTGGTSFYSFEMVTNKKITQFEEVQGLIPLGRQKIREAVIEQAKKEGSKFMLEAFEKLPEREDDGLTIISLSLLRKERE